jgi:hypothetical protein
VRLYTRNGDDFADRFSLILAAIAALPARCCLIDGEPIVTDETGLADFTTTTSRALCLQPDRRWQGSAPGAAHSGRIDGMIALCMALGVAPLDDGVRRRRDAVRSLTKAASPQAMKLMMILSPGTASVSCCHSVANTKMEDPWFLCVRCCPNNCIFRPDEPDVSACLADGLGSFANAISRSCLANSKERKRT